MKIAPDTNVLARAIVGDDGEQRVLAQAALAQADLVAITLPTLCELVWVLSSRYKVAPAAIGIIVGGFLNAQNVVLDRPAAEAGLALLAAGGDFADGVIAYEGERLGADTFVSFDRKAVRLLSARGGSARLLA